MPQLFDRVRRELPHVLAKVVVLVGDCTEVGLGLSHEERRLLQENAHFVFHCAATVRFDEPVQKAVFLNLRGTREAVDLARGFKDLKVAVQMYNKKSSSTSASRARTFRLI